MPLLSDRDARALAARIKRLETQLAGHARTAQLSFSSIDDGALLVMDSDGVDRGTIGVLPDGSVGVLTTNGPPPPTPTPAVLAPVVTALSVTWDGTFEEGLVRPLDLARVEVHVSDAGQFTPNATTLAGSIERPDGGTVVIAAGGGAVTWVRLLAVNTSGVTSQASAPVSAMADVPGAGTTTWWQADEPALPAQGDTWVDSDDGNRTYLRVGAGWQEITDARVLQAIRAATDAQAAADGKVRTFAQPSAPTGLVAGDVGDLWYDTGHGNRLYRWSGTAWAAVAVGFDALSTTVTGSVGQKLTDPAVDPATWEPVPGSAAPVSVASTDSMGGTALAKTGAAPGWWVHRVLVPFDPTVLYRVTARVRMTAAATNGIGSTLYVGLHGVAADAATYVNAAGANSAGNQHYVAAQARVLTVAEGWVTVTGYVKGWAEAGAAANVGQHSDPNAPGTMHAAVRYLRGLVIVDAQSANSAYELSHFTVETVETGAVGTLNLGAGSVTTAKVAELAVDKLTSGTSTARFTVAGKFSTAATDAGQRVEWTSAGIRAFDAAGTRTVDIPASGSPTFSGVTRTAPSGARVEIDDTGGLRAIRGDDSVQFQVLRPGPSQNTAGDGLILGRNAAFRFQGGTESGLVLKDDPARALVLRSSSGIATGAGIDLFERGADGGITGGLDGDGDRYSWSLRFYTGGTTVLKILDTADAIYSGGIQATRMRPVQKSAGNVTGPRVVSTYTAVDGWGILEFVAPPSGVVTIELNALLRSTDVGTYALGGIEVRTGNVQGAGTVVYSPSGIALNSNVGWARSGGTRLVAGLTPGGTYNARPLYAASTDNAGSVYCSNCVLTVTPCL